MEKARFFLVSLIMILLLSFSVFAAQINSTSYKQNVIVSAGGDNLTSSTYKTNIAVGIINMIINSTSYINKLGFFHLLLLANDQPCTSANQCEGGFCCSSLCKSSACSSPSPSPSGGGGSSAAAGGGGGGAAAGSSNVSQGITKEKIKSFSVSPSSVKEHIALGTSQTAGLTIKNTGETSLSFNLNVITINDMVFLSDASFSLEPGEEKIVELNIIGKKLGSYFGQVIINGGGIEKSIDVVVEVESEQVLFDAKIDIPSAYKEVAPGGDLKTQITLLNVGPSRNVDVTATYIIKDRSGNTVYESSETFAVDKQTSYVKSFKISNTMQPGEYLAIIELRYGNSFAVSSEIFKVVQKESSIEKITKSNAAITFAFTLLVGFVFLLSYLFLPKAKIFGKLRFKRKK